VRAGGIVLLALGVVAAVVLWGLGERRYDDAVSDLAPAPLGCTTTLQFDRIGTYTFFVETKGKVGEIDGDCDADDRSYDLDADDAPAVDLTLIDASGDDVDLDRADGPDYDRSGQRGHGVQTVDITDAGEYVLTATLDDDGGDSEAMVRVGRDPARGVAALRWGAVLALLVGVAGGVTLLVLSRRRPAPAPVAPSGPQWPTRPYPAPLAPPSAMPPATPVYTPRPPSYGPLAPPPSPGVPGGAPRRPDGQPASPVERPPGGWPGRGGPLPPPRPPA